MEPVREATVSVDQKVTYQTIDGFGVNINSKYWNDDTFQPAMKLLVDDLGATIYRLDAYGKSNWIDPANEFDASILTQKTYDRVYQGRDFQNAVAMGKYLNGRGIEPYITLSGIVPRWMCAGDGKTLKDYASFAEMCSSYLVWLRKQGVKFRLFGPLNETNLGPPEGPLVGPKEFPAVLAEVLKSLDKNGLSDVKLVVAEHGGVGPEFAREIAAHRNLRDRIHAFGVHSYADDDYTQVVDFVNKSPFAGMPVWMTEYGDLDQSGEHEWHFSRIIYQRLLRLLQAGMTAALNWDAFDNYHDHDEAWTIYGIIRTGLRCFTPKKRYYACKHIYRFAPVGWKRVKVVSDQSCLTTVAFAGQQAGEWTVSGINTAAESLLVRVTIPGVEKDGAALDAAGYITDAETNCCRVACEPYRPWNMPSKGYQATVPAHGIFTITTFKP
jgi:O-glycosyl hydrolase